MALVEHTTFADTGAPGYRTFSPVSATIDPDTGALYVNFRPHEGQIVSDFDEEEIFVFRDSETDEVVGLTIVNFGSYWAARRLELERYLATTYDVSIGSALMASYSHSASTSFVELPTG